MKKQKNILKEKLIYFYNEKLKTDPEARIDIMVDDREIIEKINPKLLARIKSDHRIRYSSSRQLCYEHFGKNGRTPNAKELAWGLEDLDYEMKYQVWYAYCEAIGLDKIK